MATKIYTKTGDAGQTSLIGGTRVSKASIRIEAYGTVDELNAYIGWVRDLVAETAGGALLADIQDRLFTIGSSLAADPDKAPKMRLPDLQGEDISQLEAAIDEMAARLPGLRTFILPGGAPAVSACHIARCVARRAERCCIRLTDAGAFVAPLVVSYLNRLSDYLFMLARDTAAHLGVKESGWKPRL